ncbi:MAG TPA: protein kinase, partial [Myxococcota bacterium]|nr:protein kinase [Myxococcota bacterium]
MKKPIKFGKYVLLERINIGGMAEVFKAKSFGVEGFEKLLAIKRILPNIAEDEDFITMFIDEAKIAVQLNHANIAQIYDLGKIEDSYFIALEYVHGKDLRTIWDRHKKRGLLLPIPMSVYIVSRGCEGLDYAHRKKDAAGRDLNIVHRDVSPQNVLISYEGEVKIIDFGIAKAANKASKTQAGILKGKFGYMSPEQVRGMPLDRRSDIFACGIILYELLTGERLFVGESDFSTLEKVRNVEILPPSTYNRKIPDTLEKIVLKALSKAPEDRYQSAYDMQEELQRFLILNKTNFARKDLANYMKRAFKADIERAVQRQAEYQQFTPDALEDEVSLPTSPGSLGLHGAAPKDPPAAPEPPPPPMPAPMPEEPPPAPQPAPRAEEDSDAPVPTFPGVGPAPAVFTPAEDDEDDDIATVVFDPRQHTQADDEEVSTSPGSVAPPGMRPPAGSSSRPKGAPAGASRPRGAPLGGPPAAQAPPRSTPPALPVAAPPGRPRAAPAGRRPSLQDLEPVEPEESTVTAPVNVPRPPAAVGRPSRPPNRLRDDEPTESQDEELADEPPETRMFAEDRPPGAEEALPAQPRSKLKLIIFGLAIVALLVVGLAVFKLLQQRGLLGGASTLTIQVSPPDATVYVDGQEVGKFSPNVVKDVLPGVHVIEATKDNYQPFQEEIQVVAGEDQTFDVSMTFVPAALELEYTPPDATLKMNGEQVGDKSPYTNENLVSGVKIKFLLERNGYLPKEVEWAFEPKEKRKEKLALEEILFTLEVESEPAGAQVFLDEKRLGVTPAKIPDVRAKDEHQLRIKHPRFPEWKSTIRWDGEPVKKVEARLSTEPAP